jgi:uncharacterized membrane protein YgdD (TMEM256/DUF423 family)
MLDKIVKANTTISEGFNKVQWMFYLTLLSSGVIYVLNIFHMAVFGIATPLIGIALLYLIGKAHDGKPKRAGKHRKGFKRRIFS